MTTTGGDGGVVLPPASVEEWIESLITDPSKAEEALLDVEFGLHTFTPENWLTLFTGIEVAELTTMLTFLDRTVEDDGISTLTLFTSIDLYNLYIIDLDVMNTYFKQHTNVFTVIGQEEWVKLLVKDLRLELVAEDFDVFPNATGPQWVALLTSSKHWFPLAKELSAIAKMSPTDTKALQEPFDRYYYTYVFLDTPYADFTDEQWMELFTADERNMVHGVEHDKLSKLTAPNWITLLASDPNWLATCNDNDGFITFTPEDYAELVIADSSYRGKLVKEELFKQMNETTKTKVLDIYPDYVKYFN